MSVDGDVEGGLRPSEKNLHVAVAVDVHVAVNVNVNVAVAWVSSGRC